MVIGLFDVDFNYSIGTNSTPNLELMKYFNYHYTKGDTVIFMRRGEDEGRFEKIIYFKESPRIDTPVELELSGERKSIYGYGFFGRTEPLPPEISAAKPMFLPYEPFSSKIGVKRFKEIKKHSLLRVENNDRSGFKNTDVIYVVDFNPAYQPNLIPAMDSLPNNHFKFLHSLEFRDKEAFDKLKGHYNQIYKSTSKIYFDFSEKFFISNFQDDFIFNFQPRLNESSNTYLYRLIQVILAYKKVRKTPRLILPNIYPFKKELSYWLLDKNYGSLASVYEGKTLIQKKIFSMPSELRILFKQSPQTFNINSIDFSRKM